MPTFGNTDFASATSSGIGNTVEDTIRGGYFTLTEDGTATAINVKMANSLSSKNFKCMIFRASDLAFIADTETRTIGIVSASDQQFVFHRPVNLPADDYLICLWASGGSGVASMYYESTTGTYDVQTLTFDTSGYPDPFVSDAGSLTSRLQAIYVTYTAGLTKTLGNNKYNSTGGAGHGAEHVINGYRFTASENGTVTGMATRWINFDASSSVASRLLVYRMSDFALIGETDEVALTGQVFWQEYPVSTPFDLVSGVEYLLCSWMDTDAAGSASQAYQLSGGSGSERDSATYGATAPDPLVPTIHDTDDLGCIILSYTTGLTGQPIEIRKNGTPGATNKPLFGRGW